MTIQQEVLLVLKDHQGEKMPTSQIAFCCDSPFTTSQVAGALKRLVKRGLVRKHWLHHQERHWESI